MLRTWLVVLLSAAAATGRREGASNHCSLPRVPRSHLVEHVVSCPGFADLEGALREHAAWVEGRHEAVLTGTKAHPLWSGFTLRLPADAATDKLYTDALSHSACRSVQAAVHVQHAPFTIGQVTIGSSSKSSSDGNSSRPLPWGLRRLIQPHLPIGERYDPFFNGSGVDVFIVDSGMDTTHSEFSNGNGQRKVQTRQVRNLFDLSAKVQTAPPQQNDLVGHGTHVAATIGGLTAGVSPECNLYGVRVLDSQGSGYDKDILAGLIFIWDWFHATGKKPTVVNMSLGGPCLSYEKCASNILVEAVEKLSRDGIKVVVAAGNEGCDSCLETPAFAQSAITTGASSQQDEVARFSDKGKCLDVFAPGINISSACTAALNPSCVGGGHYVALSGTSMAAPHTSGVVAQLLQIFHERNLDTAVTIPGSRYNYTRFEALTALLCTAAPLVLEVDAPYRYGSSLSRNYLLQVPFTKSSDDGNIDLSKLMCDLQDGCEEFGYCSNRGVCQNGKCLCDALFWGKNCSSTILSEQCDVSGLDAKSGSIFVPYTLFDRTGTGSGWSGSVFAILALDRKAPPKLTATSSRQQHRAHSQKDFLKMPQFADRPPHRSAPHNTKSRQLQDGIEIVLQTNLCAGFNETSGVCLEPARNEATVSFFVEVQADRTGTAPYASWSLCGVMGGAPSRWGLSLGAANETACTLHCDLAPLNVTLTAPIGSPASFTYRLLDVSSGQWLGSGTWVGSSSSASNGLTHAVGGLLSQTHQICIPSFVVSPAAADMPAVIGGCRGTRWGCCPDEMTSRREHGFCSPAAMLAPVSAIIALITHGSPDEPATISLCDDFPARNFTTGFVFVRIRLQAGRWSCVVVPNPVQSPAAMAILGSQNVTERRVEFGIFNAKPLDFSRFYTMPTSSVSSAERGGAYLALSSSTPMLSSSGGVLATDTWHSSVYKLVGVDAFRGVALGNGSLFNNSLEAAGNDHLLVALCPFNMSTPTYMNVGEWRLLIQPAESKPALPKATTGNIASPTSSPSLLPTAYPTAMPTRNYSAYQSGEKTVYEDESTSFWMTCGAYGPINEDTIKFKRSRGRAVGEAANSLSSCEQSCLSLDATDAHLAAAKLLASNEALMMLSSGSSKLVSLSHLKPENTICLGNSTTYNADVCYRMILGGGTLLSGPSWQFCDLSSPISSTSVVDFCVQDFTKCTAFVVEDSLTACVGSDDDANLHAQNAPPAPPPGGPKPPPGPVLSNMYVLMFGQGSDGWHGASWYLFSAPLRAIFSSPPAPSQFGTTANTDKGLFYPSLGLFYWRVTLSYLNLYTPPDAGKRGAQQEPPPPGDRLMDDTYMDDELVIETSRSGFPLVTQGSLALGLQTGYSSMCLADGCYLFDVSLGTRPKEVEFVMCGVIGEAGSQGILKIVDGKCLLLDSLVSCYQDEIKRIARLVIAFIAWSSAAFLLVVTAVVGMVCRRPAGVVSTSPVTYQLLLLDGEDGEDATMHPVVPAETGIEMATL